MTDMLADMVSLADHLGAEKFHCIYDARTHSSHSLMHPGLKVAQGPALVVHLGGPALQSEDIVKVLTAPHLLKELMVNSTSTVSAKSSHLNGDSGEKQVNNGSGDHSFNVPYPSSGKRLMSSFAVTDCLQIVSGTEFFVFDPTGTHLFSGPDPAFAEEPATTNTGEAADRFNDSMRNLGARAQRCDLETRTRFPDQFAPFMNLPFDLAYKLESTGSFNGIIIRMPLRTAPSAISACVPTVPSIKASHKSLRDILQGSMIFSNSLLNASCMHFHPNWKSTKQGQSEKHPIYDFTLRLSSKGRNERRQLLKDKQWKKQGVLSSLFSKAEAPEMSYAVNISYSMKANAWLYNSGKSRSIEGEDSEMSKSEEGQEKEIEKENEKERVSKANVDQWEEEKETNEVDAREGTDVWTIFSTQGDGSIREEAIKDVYRNHKLPPFCTLAARSMDEGEFSDINIPADVGLLFCNGGPVGISGLPFHIEGPFIQDTYERYPSVTAIANRKGPSTSSGSRVGWNNTAVPRQRGSIWGGAVETTSPLTRTQIDTWNYQLLNTAIDKLVPKALRSVMENNPHSKGFYKYWPYLSTMTPDCELVTNKSGLMYWLAEQPMYVIMGYV